MAQYGYYGPTPPRLTNAERGAQDCAAGEWALLSSHLLTELLPGWNVSQKYPCAASFETLATPFDSAQDKLKKPDCLRKAPKERVSPVQSLS